MFTIASWALNCKVSIERKQQQQQLCHKLRSAYISRTTGLSNEWLFSFKGVLIFGGLGVYFILSENFSVFGFILRLKNYFLLRPQ